MLGNITNIGQNIGMGQPIKIMLDQYGFAAGDILVTISKMT